MSKVFCLIFTFYNLVLGLALLNVVLAYCTEDLLPTQPIQSYKNVSKTLNEEDQVVNKRMGATELLPGRAGV